MTDKEKVIFQLSETYKVLEIVTPHFNQIMDYEGMIQGCKDAIALLKEQEDEIAKFCGEVARLTALLEEQEAKSVILLDADEWYMNICKCPDCKERWMSESKKDSTHFCPNCGRPVKWE